MNQPLTKHDLNPCPLCGGHAAFHGGEPGDECAGCCTIVCKDCKAGFDLAYTVDAYNTCSTMEQARARMAYKWNHYKEPLAAPAGMALN